jgi:hypothetical protein
LRELEKKQFDLDKALRRFPRHASVIVEAWTDMVREACHILKSEGHGSLDLSSGPHDSHQQAAYEIPMLRFLFGLFVIVIILYAVVWRGNPAIETLMPLEISTLGSSWCQYSTLFFLSRSGGQGYRSNSPLSGSTQRIHLKGIDELEQGAGPRSDQTRYIGYYGTNCARFDPVTNCRSRRLSQLPGVMPCLSLSLSTRQVCGGFGPNRVTRLMPLPRSLASESVESSTGLQI